MSTRQRYMRQRKALFDRQNGRCYYCEIRMFLPPDGKFKPGCRRLDACTLEHLDDKYSPDRGKRQGEFRRVAACRHCNERRSDERTAELTREQKWALSGRKPQEMMA